MSFSCKAVLRVLPKIGQGEGKMTENIPLHAIEDKELRKKLRNRQSALAARERKKARMLELEKQVAELQEAGRRAEEENAYLRKNLDILIKKCLQAGMRFDNEKDMLQISQPFANQTNYPPRLNHDIYRQIVKQAGCFPERVPHDQKSREMPVRSFGQHYSLIDNDQQRPAEYRSAHNFYKETQKNIMEPVSAGLQGHHQQGIHGGYSSASTYPKSFVSLSQPISSYSNVPIKQENFDRTQNAMQAGSQSQILQPHFNDGYKGEVSAPSNAYNIYHYNCNTTTTNTSKLPAAENRQALRCNNPSGNSLKRTLSSVAGALGSPPKCHRRDISDSPDAQVAAQPSPGGSHDAFANSMKQETIAVVSNGQENETQSYLENRIDISPQNFDFNDSMRSSSEQQTISSDAQSLLSLHTQKDINLITSDNRKIFLPTEFKDIFSSNKCDSNENIAIVDFQDILLDDNSSVSPSSKSASDLSLDDHFDWVDENLIFAI